MRVICRLAKGYDLPQDYKGLYFTAQTKFHITVGQQYDVYATSFYNGGLIILLIDETGLPEWFPVELFEFSDDDIPHGWKLVPIDNEASKTVAVCGHPRLVGDIELLDALSEHDEAALSIFWKEVAVDR